MKREQLKTPEDYEIFSFRSTTEEKDELNADIDAVVVLYNRKLPEGERKWRKNDVIMEALRIGLAAMKKKSER